MKVPRDNNRHLLRYARQLRDESTDAERKLWSILRSRALSGYKFRRQHPVGGYIIDFYCVRAKLSVELDGGQHTLPENMKYDATRTDRLNNLGVRVLRFSDVDMLRHPDAVALAILRALTEEKPSPQPSPGVPGEGAGEQPGHL